MMHLSLALDSRIVFFNMRRLLLAGFAVFWVSPLLAEPSRKDVCQKKITTLKGTLAKNPQDANAWLELRICANELKDWSEAVEIASAAKAKNPNNAEPRLILGLAQMHGKDYE